MIRRLQFRVPSSAFRVRRMPMRQLIEPRTLSGFRDFPPALMIPRERLMETARRVHRSYGYAPIDTIGTTSNAADIEVALVIYDLMKALGFERSVLRINNRMILNGLLEELGLAGQTKSVLIALDKLPKIGREAVLLEMAEHGVGAE